MIAEFLGLPTEPTFARSRSLCSNSADAAGESVLTMPPRSEHEAFYRFLLASPHTAIRLLLHSLSVTLLLLFKALLRRFLGLLHQFPWHFLVSAFRRAIQCRY